MPLPKRYNPKLMEPALNQLWMKSGTYHFNSESSAQVYSIDTPPATVSGKLHLGHTYSYSHPDFIARFWRMNGYNVFYPMGFDDNGLPTGRLVEKQLGMRASELGRANFIEECIKISEQAEDEYKQIWQRLGLSNDWRYTYRTIDERSRRIAQISFLRLQQKGLIYRKDSPTIWCPECETAIAQAELEDMEKESEYVFLKFRLLSENAPCPGNTDHITIATTRPELLCACVALFVHPDDERFRHLVGKMVEVPIFKQQVPILQDPLADPEKGTGAVMCCTFGDQTDVIWCQTHKLPMIEAVDKSGKMTSNANQFKGFSIHEARLGIINALKETDFLVSRLPTKHTVRVHERCDTPVEYIATSQWFIRVLNFKDSFLDAGKKVNWVPSHMRSRYENWVENLSWDWCISRQRYFGVPFPVWYCKNCQEVKFAQEDQLPIDPQEEVPDSACQNCGESEFKPDTDVMDTWATSSMTPQIAGGWLSESNLYQKVAPFSLRPQAHEIIRTWAFYTIVKSSFHFDSLPWQNALISGWGIAGDGMGKISKSRGGGPMSPMEMIETYSADAVRYWAASTSPGKDAVISERKIQTGLKLVNKLWNVARFSAPFIEGYQPKKIDSLFTPADRWILSKSQRVIQQATEAFESYDYTSAKTETEVFFWKFADNYIEMAKQRLYNRAAPQRNGAVYSLHHVLLTLLKLFAPILPYVTEQIYRGVFLDTDGTSMAMIPNSIHSASWPKPDEAFYDIKAESLGELLINIASQVRRFKSERNLPLGTSLNQLQLATSDTKLSEQLSLSIPDLTSITRSIKIEISEQTNNQEKVIYQDQQISIAIDP